MSISIFPFYIFVKDFIFRERGREGRREGEKHGMCPDRESNQQPFLCWMMPNQLSHTGHGQ